MDFLYLFWNGQIYFISCVNEAIGRYCFRVLDCWLLIDNDIQKCNLEMLIPATIEFHVMSKF